MKVKQSSTWCVKSFAHILTSNISETTKDVKTNPVNSESLQSQLSQGMFKDFQCQHYSSHDKPHADSQILAKPIPAVHCQRLQQLLFIVPSAHPRP